MLQILTIRLYTYINFITIGFLNPYPNRIIIINNKQLQLSRLGLQTYYLLSHTVILQSGVVAAQTAYTFIARVVSKPLLLVMLFETSFSLVKNVLFSVIIRLFMMFFILQFMFIVY